MKKKQQRWLLVLFAMAVILLLGSFFLFDFSVDEGFKAPSSKNPPASNKAPSSKKSKRESSSKKADAEKKKTNAPTTKPVMKSKTRTSRYNKSLTPTDGPAPSPHS